MSKKGIVRLDRAELGKFGDKGLSLMIENRWLEEPPRAPDRTALTKKARITAVIHKEKTLSNHVIQNQNN